MGYIAYWSSNETDEAGCSGEYVIMTDDEPDEEWIEANTKSGYRHWKTMKITEDFPREFPLDYVMEKEL